MIELILFLISMIWLLPICIILATLIGCYKQWGALMGFVLGLLLGPIGVIIMLVSPSKNADKLNRYIDNNDEAPKIQRVCFYK